ncbi:MAG: glycerol-3-phosphate acyltransferase [bacterium]
MWLRFRGGEGVATSFGVVLAFAPIVAVIGALAWTGLVFFTRIPTIGMVATTLFVVLVRFAGQPFLGAGDDAAGLRGGARAPRQQPEGAQGAPRAAASAAGPGASRRSAGGSAARAGVRRRCRRRRRPG